MRGVAEFVMRGRWQALLVICISAGTVLFFWVGAAALALVTLRRGLTEGLILLMWSLLPASAVFYYSNEFAPLAALLGSFVTAAALRHTSSWQVALLFATACGLLTGIVLLVFAGDYIAAIEAVIADFIVQWQAQLAQQGQNLTLSMPDAAFIVGVFSLMNALTVVVCVVLGRSWQAGLFNPGGFREEFHRIRLTPAVALSLVLIGMACLMVGGSWLPWAFLATVPCLIAGISLMHGLVGIKGLKGYWLVSFYVLLLLVNPMKELVILAALLDSRSDFRQRLSSSV